MRVMHGRAAKYVPVDCTLYPATGRCQRRTCVSPAEVIAGLKVRSVAATVLIRAVREAAVNAQACNGHMLMALTVQPAGKSALAGAEGESVATEFLGAARREANGR